MPVRISVKKELFRKSIHLCSAFVPLFLKYFYWFTITMLALLVISYCVCEILRLKGKIIPLISVVTETAARTRDEDKFVLGPVTLVCGILLCALTLPYECAIVGIFALAFGDGCASLIGKIFGRIKIPHMKGKTVEGCLACFLAVLISTFCVCQNFRVSFFVALLTMCIEVLPLFDFDNLLIPFCAGGAYGLILSLINPFIL